MTPEELATLPPTLAKLAVTEVELDGVTKPVHVWATERKLSLEKIRDRRVRNNWADSLQKGNLTSKSLRTLQKPKPNMGVTKTARSK